MDPRISGRKLYLYFYVCVFVAGGGGGGVFIFCSVIVYVDIQFICNHREPMLFIMKPYNNAAFLCEISKSADPKKGPFTSLGELNKQAFGGF